MSNTSNDSTTDDTQSNSISSILEQYSSGPKSFTVEEKAVMLCIQNLAFMLSAPKNQRAMFGIISTEELEAVTKDGQITMLAEKLGDDFLVKIEDLVKNSDINFTTYTDNIPKPTRVKDLYAKCAKELQDEMGGQQPDFSDVLIRMYTTESSFYKQINAIVCRYNDPRTTPEEKQLALLLNVAIHKAGLKKKELEQQDKAPEIVYRGQKFGTGDVIKKLNEVMSLYQQNQLGELDPEKLRDLDIGKIFIRNRNASTSDLVHVAENFASMGPGEEGFVCHIRNMGEVADLYNVLNISAIKSEREFMTRLPDDVVILPVREIKAEKNSSGEIIHHIEVVCIRSEALVANNTQLFRQKQENLLKLIEDVRKKLPPNKNLQEEKVDILLSMLANLTEDTKQKLSTHNPQDQRAFVEVGLKFLIELHNNAPSPAFKTEINKIKQEFESLSMIFSDLDVTHKNYDVQTKIKQKKTDLTSLLTGLNRWYNGLEQQTISNLPSDLKNDIEILCSLSKQEHPNLIQIKRHAENVARALGREENDAFQQNHPNLIKNCVKMVENVQAIENLRFAALPENERYLLEKVGIVDSNKINEKLANIDVNQRDNRSGKTLIMIASSLNNATLVSSLIEKSANLDIKDNEGKTALMHAMGIDMNHDIAKKFIALGADIHLLDKNGQNALMYAIQACDKDLVETLVKAGSNVNTIDNQGYSVLMHALSKKPVDEAVVKILMDAGAKLNKPEIDKLKTNLKSKLGHIASLCEQANLNIGKDINEQTEIKRIIRDLKLAWKTQNVPDIDKVEELAEKLLKHVDKSKHPNLHKDLTTMAESTRIIRSYKHTCEAGTTNFKDKMKHHASANQPKMDIPSANQSQLDNQSAATKKA